MKRLFVLFACLLAVPAQGQILSIIMGGTNQPAATPTFSPAAGAVTNPTTVTASTSTSDGCTIYFDTTNPPVTAQTTYSVTTGVTLYAQARGCAHHSDSLVGSATYTITGPLYTQLHTSSAVSARVRDNNANWLCSGDQLFITHPECHYQTPITSISDNGGSGGSTYHTQRAIPHFHKLISSR